MVEPVYAATGGLGGGDPSLASAATPARGAWRSRTASRAIPASAPRAQERAREILTAHEGRLSLGTQRHRSGGPEPRRQVDLRHILIRLRGGAVCARAADEDHRRALRTGDRKSPSAFPVPMDASGASSSASSTEEALQALRLAADLPAARIRKAHVQGSGHRLGSYHRPDPGQASLGDPMSTVFHAERG